MTKVTSLADAITAAIGKNDDKQKCELFLDTGMPQLNRIVSGKYDGGLPVGRMIEIFGPSQSGKTVIATKAMIAAQKSGGIAAFLDYERAYMVDLAQHMGLSVDPSKWVYRRPKTFEDGVDMIKRLAIAVRDSKLIDERAPICIVCDSLAMMVPKSKLGKDAADGNMNDTTALARATSSWFPALMQIAEEHNICLIFLNQRRTKVGVVYGDPTTTPGGQAPEFCASVRLSLSTAAIKKGDEHVGNRVTCTTRKNKIIRGGMKTTWDFTFEGDTGNFDIEGSIVDHMVEKKILPSNGAWITWVDGKKYVRSQLSEKIRKEDAMPLVMKTLAEYQRNLAHEILPPTKDDGDDVKGELAEALSAI